MATNTDRAGAIRADLVRAAGGDAAVAVAVLKAAKLHARTYIATRVELADLIGLIEPGDGADQ